MKDYLPNYEEAVVAESKIVDYLLSPTHRDGRAKAAFFSRYGFTPESWQIMADTLRRHAAEYPVTKVEPSPFGTRYVIEGKIDTPDGRKPSIRSIWFVASGETQPYFVTAYPLKRRRS